MERILIVCVGNICRSPMGEALLASKLKDKGSQIKVRSAGLNALVGKPAVVFAQELMHELKLDISSHRGCQLTPEILFNSDIIFTMTSGQQEQLECSLPSIRGRVHRLGKWGGYDVPDPYRRPKEAFVQSLELIKQGIEDWCVRLWN